MERGEDARSRLGAARVARLATAGADGRPHLVPFCFALDGDLLYSAVDWKPKSTGALRRLDNVRQNPHVSVLADHYEEAWEKLWWVRVDGVAAVLPEGEESARARELLAAKYAQYRARPAAGAVLRIEARRWRSWP